MPRQAADATPKTDAGIVCSLSDRLDSLVGLFSAGLAPTASTDIYGLRRIVYAMLEASLTNNRLDSLFLHQTLQIAGLVRQS